MVMTWGWFDIPFTTLHLINFGDSLHLNMTCNCWALAPTVEAHARPVQPMSHPSFGLGVNALTI